MKFATGAVERLKTEPTIAGLFFVFLVALGLRLINLGAEPLWGDEILSLGIVQQFPSIRDLVTYISWVEIHPPLYYILLHYWIGLFGASEFAIRFLSVLGGLGIVALTYVLGRLLFASRWLGVIAALIVAVLPLQIEMSTDARPYTLYTACGLVAGIALWKYLQTYRLVWLIPYACSLVIGFYLHYSAAYIIAVLALTWLGFIFWKTPTSRRRAREIVRWLVVQAAIIVGYAPWLSSLFYKLELRRFSLFGLESFPDPSQRTAAFVHYVPQQLIWLAKENLISRIEVATIWLVEVVVLGLLFWHLTARARQGKPLVPHEHRAPLSFVASMLIATLVVYLFSPQSVPYTDIYVRHILIATSFIALLIAYFVYQLPRRLGMAFLALFLVSLLTFVVNIVGNDENWDVQHRVRFVAGVINTYHQPGDLILTENAFFRTDFNHYLRPDLAAVPFMPINYTDIDFYNTRNTLGLMENELQFRLHPATAPQVFQKFDYLMKHYQPKRVWLPYFTSPLADIYFTTRGWRKIVWSRRPLLMLDMYEAPPAVPVEKTPTRSGQK